MIGGRRSGKTSALAAMASQFPKIAGSANLILEMDEAETFTASKLQQRLDGLRTLAADDPNERYGVDGDGVEHRFLFFLTDGNAKEGEGRFHLQFQDYPGAWFDSPTPDSDQDPEEYERVEEFVRESHAVVVAIDTPYLVEHNGVYNEARNRVTRVVRLLKPVYGDRAGKHLIILVPLRCERYMQTAGDRLDLLQRVQSSYQPLIEMCRNLPKATVRVVATPVKTAGCIMFSHFEHDTRMPYLPVAHFERVGRRFHPQYTDQPLRHLLRFAVSRVKVARDMGFFGIWDNTSGLSEAIAAFSAGTRTTDGFGVLLDGWSAE